MEGENVKRGEIGRYVRIAGDSSCWISSSFQPRGVADRLSPRDFCRPRAAVAANASDKDVWSRSHHLKNRRRSSQILEAARPSSPAHGVPGVTVRRSRPTIGPYWPHKLRHGRIRQGFGSRADQTPRSLGFDGPGRVAVRNSCFSGEPTGTLVRAAKLQVQLAA